MTGPVKKKLPGMFGLGIDLVEVVRIRRLSARRAFLQRCFTTGELAYSLGKNKYERLAARFAVKEAVIKALDARHLALKDIEVENTASGSPRVRIKKILQTGLTVSISHTASYAVAAVIVFKK